MENAAAVIDRWDGRFSPFDLKYPDRNRRVREPRRPVAQVGIHNRPVGKWRRASSSGRRWSCRGIRIVDERKETGSGTRSFPRTGLTGQKSPLWFLARVCLISASRSRARFYEAIKARTRTRASNDRQTRKSGKDGQLRGRMGEEEKKEGGVRTRPHLTFLHPVGNR